jgi:hypothetical protein
MRNPWLFMWVLPYLVLSLCSGGLHNHPLAQHLMGLANAGQGRGTVAYQAASAARPQSESGCAACQWLTHSNGYVAPAPAVPALAPSLEAQPSPVTQPSTVITLGSHIRAPPFA